MTHGRHDRQESGPETHTLVAVAAGIAGGVAHLLPGCGGGVVIGIRGEWQLVAQRGPVDVRAGWCDATANRTHASRISQRDESSLIAPFSSFDTRALLVVSAAPTASLDPEAFGVVQPLLDAGGVLLDRALAAQERDRAVRRVIVQCEERNDRPARSLGDLEQSLAGLWPNGAARFHARIGPIGAPWSTRRLVAAACELGEPAIGRSAREAGLLPPDLTYHVAIPMPRHDGAIVVEAFAAGEGPDAESVATAISMTRTLGSPPSALACH
jgi:hypothetical protein